MCIRDSPSVCSTGVHQERGRGYFPLLPFHLKRPFRKGRIPIDVYKRQPLSQAHLVSRYIGLGSKTPELNKRGDSKWQRAKKSAERSVADYAAQLRNVQAERQTGKGYSHPPDLSLIHSSNGARWGRCPFRWVTRLLQA